MLDSVSRHRDPGLGLARASAGCSRPVPIAARPIASTASSELPPMCGVARKLGRREQLRGPPAAPWRTRRSAAPARRPSMSMVLEGDLVDQPAAGRVDQHARRASSAPSARRSACCACCRPGARAGVTTSAAAQQVVEPDRLDLVRRVELGEVEDVVGQHRASEARAGWARGPCRCCRTR